MSRTPEYRATTLVVLSVEPSLTTKISASCSTACFKSASRQFPIREAPLNVGTMIDTDIELVGVDFRWLHPTLGSNYLHSYFNLWKRLINGIPRLPGS